METTTKNPRKQALLPILQVHQTLRRPRPDLDGDDVAFLLAIAGWLGYGKKPTVVGKYEFRVALSTIQEFLQTGKSKVVASRKKLEQFGIIALVHPGKQSDHVPATYKINVDLIGTGVPTQNADTCMAGSHSETPRGSGVERRGVPRQDPAGFRRETVRSSLEHAEHGEDQIVTASASLPPDAHTVAATVSATTPATAPVQTYMSVMIRDAITNDHALMKITGAQDVDTIIAEYTSAPIDALAVIRSASDYLRTDKGRTIRNGADHLRRRLQWAIDKAKKEPPPKPKTSYIVDFDKHPELLPQPRRGVRS